MTLLSELRKNQDAAIGADGLDSAEVTTIAQSAGIAVYTALDSLPSSGLTSGDQAWVESSGRLYISNGSGWYNVALINASPTLTLDQSGTIQLNADTLTVTVTASASDSDDNQDIISFSVESDGNMVGTGTTISQDSSVFTITALSEDSGGTAGNFTLTFKATDQIAVDNEALSFSLSFSAVVDSSASTMLLMKADGNNATNAAITHQDSDNTSIDFTETGTPYAGTFTPYRSGGYSIYFDGGGAEVLTGYSSDFAFGTGDWTVDFWVYANSWTSEQVPLSIAPANNFGPLLIYYYQSNLKYYSSTSGSAWAKTGIDIITSPDTNRWYHIAVVRNGNTLKTYVDGSETSSESVTGYNYSANNRVRLGNGWSSDVNHNGYLHDVRVVKGTAVYTSAFTPPTEKLDAVTNTKYLSARLPYIVDESTSSHSLTLDTGPETKPLGPYDYEPWTADDHGGSVYVDGSSYAVSTDAGDTTNLGTGDFTAELWFRRTGAVGNSFHDMIVSTRGDGLLEEGDFEFYVGPADDGVIGLQAHTGSNWAISGGAVRNNVWHHIAAVRNSGTITLYLDGVSIATRSDTGQFGGEDGLVLGGFGNGSYKSKGYISDIRFIAGTAVYTANFTPPTSLTTQVAGTKFLMQNKSDANIYDAAAANAFTLLNDTSSSTTQRKFTTSSAVYFDGTNDDVTAYDFGLGGDVTFEGWIYQTAATDNVYKWIFGSSNYGSAGPFGLYTYGTGLDLWLTSSGGPHIDGTIAQNTWYHVAIVRNSGTWTMYLDGVSQGTSTTNGTVDWADTTDWRWGTSAASQGTYDWTGYMQDWRISDTARYTANFTPPTAEFEL